MRRADLVPECESCAAVCCIAVSFEASADFAFDKAANERCRHLTRDARCGIYAKRVALGCSGCTLYDCYGAGQRVTRAFAGARDAEQRNDAFLVLRVVHELLWLLTEAVKLCPPSCAELTAELERQIAALDAIAAEPDAPSLAFDLQRQETTARALLRRVGTSLGGRRGARALPVLE